MTRQELCPRRWGFLWRTHCLHFRDEGYQQIGRCRMKYHAERVYCCLCELRRPPTLIAYH